jgi:hypothetical protein
MISFLPRWSALRVLVEHPDQLVLYSTCARVAGWNRWPLQATWHFDRRQQRLSYHRWPQERGQSLNWLRLIRLPDSCQSYVLEAGPAEVITRPFGFPVRQPGRQQSQLQLRLKDQPQLTLASLSWPGPLESTSTQASGDLPLHLIANKINQFLASDSPESPSTQPPAIEPGPGIELTSSAEIQAGAESAESAARESAGRSAGESAITSPMLPQTASLDELAEMARIVLLEQWHLAGRTSTSYCRRQCELETLLRHCPQDAQMHQNLGIIQYLQRQPLAAERSLYQARRLFLASQQLRRAEIVEVLLAQLRAMSSPEDLSAWLD